MNPAIDQYLTEGCGRCPLGGTPECKVHDWKEVLTSLRALLLDTPLTEELKWSVPCYTFQNRNVLILSAFKNHASISFFKGSLLKDPDRLLEKPGENSQAARVLKFTDVKQVAERKEHLRAFIQQAIELEKAGKKVAFKKQPEAAPEELLEKFQESPALKEAFEALTPGRQRGYILYFSGAKQSKTRHSRIEKYTPKILAGKGFHDR
jgi:uncharacterized protein YdeI (YjbR/CyaY-like superfamily)